MFEAALGMRPKAIALVAAGAVLGIATLADRRPYEASIHSWGVSLLVALIGIALLVFSLRLMRGANSDRWAALASFGGIVIAVAFLAAELLVGPPRRVVASPGQRYQPSPAARLTLMFPPLGPADLSNGRSPTSIVIDDGGNERLLEIGQEQRIRDYALRADAWPAAYVRAHSPAHIAQTVTQPASTTFVSPVLQFPNLDQDGMPIDTFSVPALHRDVHVKYYAGLPAHGIDVPFVQLAIAEENGSSLYEGVAVSDRPLRRAGVELVFDLGSYPVVSIASAPDRFVYLTGAALIVIGAIAFLISVLVRSPK